MTDCTKCEYYQSQNNRCKLFRVQLQKPGSVDECRLDPNKPTKEDQCKSQIK